MPLPEFRANGTLPPGHVCSWQEFRERFAYNQRRREQYDGLVQAARLLAAANCTRLFIDGSYVTTKELPGDWDGCWDPRGVDPGKLHSTLVDIRYRRPSQTDRFKGQFFISEVEVWEGRRYLEFFQEDRQGNAKGIVLLDPREVSTDG